MFNLKISTGDFLGVKYWDSKNVPGTANGCVVIAWICSLNSTRCKRGCYVVIFKAKT